ncbi:hypothetical protein [Malikia spinosa]|uniref:hypothetical protein n=1 Tax=Malikia spinosa TaxID=86180 RepID=UPI0027B97421|nr:hypothetical protein [Malikia spinosa]
MAARQDHIGRNGSQLTDWLAVPRPITLLLLVVFGAVGGELLWRYLDSITILAWAAGMATSLCTMCATAVWAMRDKLDEIDTEGMSSTVYEKFRKLTLEHRSRSKFWASLTMLMSLLVSAPVVSKELAEAVWHWMIPACGGAVGVTLYAYMLANYWDQQIHAFKHKQAVEYRKQREKEAVKASASAARVPFAGKGWVEGTATSVQ